MTLNAHSFGSPPALFVTDGAGAEVVPDPVAADRLAIFADDRKRGI
jgi:hypothetical protein